MGTKIAYGIRSGYGKDDALSPEIEAKVVSIIIDEGIRRTRRKEKAANEEGTCKEVRTRDLRGAKEGRESLPVYRY
jgi:hypothetical protein